MKKFIRQSHDILLQTLNHDLANWREVELNNFKLIREEELAIASIKGGINIEGTIRKVEELLTKF